MERKYEVTVRIINPSDDDEVIDITSVNCDLHWAIANACSSMSQERNPLIASKIVRALMDLSGDSFTKLEKELGDAANLVEESWEEGAQF